MQADQNTPWDCLTFDDSPAAPQVSPRLRLAAEDMIVFRRQLGRVQEILDLIHRLPLGFPSEAYNAIGRFAHGSLTVMEYVTVHGNTPPEAFDLMPWLQDLSDRARELIGRPPAAGKPSRTSIPIPDPVPPTPEHRMRVAEGFLEIGLAEEALAEMNLIEESVQLQPQVLAARVPILSVLREWDAVRIIARCLATAWPGDAHWPTLWADATVHCVTEPTGRFLCNPWVKFDYACLECQRGNLESARLHLAEALQQAPDLRREALREGSLAPLHHDLV